MKLIGLSPVLPGRRPESSERRKEALPKEPSIRDYIIDVPLVGITTEARADPALTFKLTSELNRRQPSDNVVTEHPKANVDAELGKDEEQEIKLRLWDDFVFTADYQAIQASSSKETISSQKLTRMDWRVQADDMVFLGFGIHATEWGRNDYSDKVDMDSTFLRLSTHAFDLMSAGWEGCRYSKQVCDLFCERATTHRGRA